MRQLSVWAPAVVLGLGSLLTMGVNSQQETPLRSPLAPAIPAEMGEYKAREVVISDAERRTAGMDDYLMRIYRRSVTEETAGEFSLYVGYYETQAQGRTIHSPKNCLPGAGWEALTSNTALLATVGGTVAVNRYLLQRGEERALVLYWYQGRGRVEANEYKVKWDLLRDSALRGRSEEALVRVIVPIVEDEQVAFELASSVAGTIIPALDSALPI